MKKALIIILAVILVLALAFTGGAFYFFGGFNGAINHVKGKILGEEPDGTEIFKALYAVSEPTKVVTDYTTQIGNATLVGKATLTTGTLNDGKKATVYVYSYEMLQSIEAGAGNKIIPITGEPITGSREYVEGKGERIDGGGWDELGTNFAPKAGSIAINLDSTKIKNCVYSESGSLKTLSFVVEVDNIEAVFGEGYEIFSDANVTITANDVAITGITVSYTEVLESEDEDIIYPDAIVTISTVYTYGIEEVTLVKK